MSILLFGAQGQLGRELASTLGVIGPVLPLCRTQVDLATPLAAAAVIAHHQPRVVINAAAYTHVDAAESEPELAQRINGDAVGEIAEACRTCGAHLLHFSTDYVFPGTGSAPHTEADAVGPVNTYGRSKLDGERQAIHSGCSVTILRTSWLHAPQGKNFIRTILERAQHTEHISVVNDQFGAPTFARWLADIATTIAARSLVGECKLPTVLHAASRGCTTWHEVAQVAVAVAIDAGMQLRLTPHSVTPISSTAFHSAATRPTNSRMSIALLEKTLAIECPPWTEGVRETAYAIARELHR